MSKYSEMLEWDLEANVLQCIDPELTENEVESKIAWWSPAKNWRCCCEVLDSLLAITTGINLKSDGTATTEINGKQESAGGGHCRAICELYLMAHYAEVNHG